MKRELILTILIVISSMAQVLSQQQDRWYILNLGTKPAGLYKESVVHTKNEVSTNVSIKMKLSRLNSEVIIESKQTQMESKIGILSSIISESHKIITKAVVHPEKIVVTNIVGGKESTNEILYTGELIGYEGIRLKTLKLEKNGDSIAYRTFIPDYGMVVEGKRKYISREEIEIGGRLVIATKVSDSFKGLPTVRLIWLDNEGNLLKSSESSPLGQMNMILSDERSAIAASNQPLELSEDQYLVTIAKTNVRLPQARRIEEVTVQIKHKLPEVGFPDFSGSYQRVISKTKDNVTLTITRPEKGKFKEVPEPQTLKHFIQSNAFLNSEDTLVIKAVNQIVGHEKDPWAKALLIRNWVNTRMKFNTGISLVPSTEVIRKMEGTCTSFATINTTLCRAAGIPARYVMGYVYLDGMWGGHAWTEVYIDDTWLPIDATLASPEGIADAARFYFTRTSASNGIGEYLIGGSQLYSNVDIKIIDYKLDGKIYKSNEKVYEVNEKGYLNAGLGIRLSKISGFEFSDMDHVYPNNLLLTLGNPTTSQEINLFQKQISPRADFEMVVQQIADMHQITGVHTNFMHQGNLGIKITTTKKSLLAILNGMDVFVFICKGADSEQLLNQVMDGFKLKKSKLVTFDKLRPK